MKRLNFLLLLPLMLVSACSTKNKLDDNKLVIGCSPTPHAVILREAQSMLKNKGYTLEIKEIQDYVTPNTLLEAGDLDANYFQHVPYLEDFNAKNNTHISWACKVHFEPMGIYSTKYTTLSSASIFKVAIPNDTSNGQRARDLLKANGISATLIEMEAQAIPSILDDVDYAVINGNYALSSNILNKCLATEDANSPIALELANVIAVKTDSLKYKWVEELKSVMTSAYMREFINSHFGSAVKAVF